MITIGFQLMLYGLAGWKWGSDQRQINLPFSESKILFQNDQVAITQLNAATLAIAVAVLLIIYLLINRTKLGLAMKACQQNVNASRMNGIPSDRILAISFGISSIVGNNSRPINCSNNHFRSFDDVGSIAERFCSSCIRRHEKFVGGGNRWIPFWV